eukprot:CAMPEP_0170601824 /NCGR_PEP_ID=MMETSP0224-20130122/18063_1 /TAXON_ID=285029 /ORGANISM="Togula jolla, Strain CCCM 725" /LENGTH=282 /DNA_ID=CAMNT_0010926621 /DNA_START=66 /DNA_END=910 /DNA_ORIENTATION=-
MPMTSWNLKGRSTLLPAGLIFGAACCLLGGSGVCFQAPFRVPGVDGALRRIYDELPSSSPLHRLPERPPFPTDGLLGLKLSGGAFLVVETILLLVLELTPESKLSTFVARKICHSGTGLLMLTLSPEDHSAMPAVLLIVVSSLAMTWNLTKPVGIPPFRFGAEKDVGITIYLVLVMSWFQAGLAPAALAPLFFADPAGAVIGKAMSRNLVKNNPAWYKEKTVFGSAAVLIVTYVALVLFFPPLSLFWRTTLSIVAMVGEAIGGDYDNLCQALAVLVLYYYVV